MIHEVLIGQKKAWGDFLGVINASRSSGGTFPHILVEAPSGMGKKTFAEALVSMWPTGGGILTPKDDAVATLNRLDEGALLCVVDAEELPKFELDRIAWAMQHYEVSYESFKGKQRFRQITLPVKPFVCAIFTNDAAALGRKCPDLITWCDKSISFEPYTPEELLQVIALWDESQGHFTSPYIAALIAGEAAGSTGRAIYILHRARRFALNANSELTEQCVRQAIGRMDATLSAADRPRREPIPRDVQTFVWQRDRGMCVQCGSKENLEFDHVIPHCKGGSDTARNIQLLCETCNRSKGAKI